MGLAPPSRIANRAPPLPFEDNQAPTHEIIHDHIFCKFFIEVLEAAFAGAKGAAIKFAGYSKCNDSSFLRAGSSEAGIVSALAQSQSCASDASNNAGSSIEGVFEPDTITIG